MTTETKSESTKIIRCSCPHEYQDQRYGKGRRVMNPTRKGDDKKKQYRCSVCEAVHFAGD